MAPPNKDINSDALREQNRQVLFMHWLGELEDLDDEIKALKDKRKSLKKKAALKGILGKDLEYGLKQANMTDQNVPFEEYRRHGEILGYLGIMPNFVLQSDRAPGDERIAAIGHKAGVMGRPAESGYAKGSKEDGWWMAGHDKGRKLRMDRLADALEEADDAAKLKTEVVKGTNKAGKPLDGDLPPEAAAAPKKPGPEKPGKPKAKAKPGNENDGKTNAELEEERQKNADFLN
jgi:hypothetical protein